MDVQPHVLYWHVFEWTGWQGQKEPCYLCPNALHPTRLIRDDGGKRRTCLNCTAPLTPTTETI